MSVQRFIYVAKPLAPTVRHLYFGTDMVEGEKVACGARMHPKWVYGVQPTNGLPICKNCMRNRDGNMPRILVHRVRHGIRSKARATARASVRQALALSR